MINVEQPKKRLNEWYGWVPDIPDARDKRYKIRPKVKLADLPPKVDLRDKFPFPLYDQGRLGSCTANAIGAAIEYDLVKQGEEDFTPSRLFIYYNERDMEGTVNEDSGAMIRDGIKSVNQLGVCHESIWTYDISKFTTKPSDTAYSEAEQHQAVLYERIDRSLLEFKAVLMEGYPFVFGFSVYESFEGYDVAKTGMVPMPLQDEQLLGGHAVLAVGYDDDNSRFIVRNSWGNDWGDKGYFYLPYDFLTNEDLSDDFWTIRVME